jgi:hypothetical protein
MRSAALAAAGVVAASLSLLPGTAAAADPSPQAQEDLGFALQYCADNDAPKYVASRDRALAQAPSLRTWGGLIRNKWIAKDAVAKCDRDMTALTAKQGQESAARARMSEVRSACSDVSSGDAGKVAAYQKARAALVALGPAASALTIDKDGAETGTAMLARCDSDAAAGTSDVRDAPVRARMEDLSRSCTFLERGEPDQVAAYKKARAALVALGPSAGNVTERGGTTTAKTLVAGCDRKLAEVVEGTKRMAAERKAEEQRMIAAEKKREADKRHRAALVASLRGDRARIFKEGGEPDITDEELLHGKVWQYERTVGIANVSAEVKGKTVEGVATTRCTYRFEFAGDKLVHRSTTGLPAACGQ